MNRAEALEKIRANIDKFGCHIYSVACGPNPRFAYSIGLSQDTGREVIVAGSSFYSTIEVRNLINNVVIALRIEGNWQKAKFDFGSMGTFSLREVNVSWSSKLILGALDYYKSANIAALQIVPDAQHATIDVPNLSIPWSARLEPVWQWLEQPWELDIPKDSMAVTNLDALKGNPITEAMRWKEKEWELFSGAGPETKKEEIRIVPLGTLLAVDPSLANVTKLIIGSGVWRDPIDLEWRRWERRK